MEIEKTIAGKPVSKKQKTSTSDKIMMFLVTLALVILFIPKSLTNKLDALNADTSAVLVRLEGSFNDGGQISAGKSVALLKSLCGKPTLKTLILQMRSFISFSVCIHFG